jgi:hypothetical protein
MSNDLAAPPRNADGEHNKPRRLITMIPCPRCGAGLTGGASCPTCGLALVGDQAAALWQVDLQLTEVDRQIATLSVQRQHLWIQHVGLLGQLGETAPMPLPSFQGGVLPAFQGGVAAPSTPSFGDTLARPRREWTPRRVQNLLLTIGAMLLVIATAIFTVVSWHRLGDGWQTLILTGVAVGSACLTRFLSRRALTATAEAISAICVGLTLFDAEAAHHVLLGALSDRPYWAVATAVLALVCAGLGWLTGVRVPWIAAAILALVPLLVLAFGAEEATATRALLLALDALLAALALAALRRFALEGRTANDVRLCWIAGGSAAWAGGFTVPVSHLLYGLGGASLATVLGGLAASGCAAAVTAWTVGEVRLRYDLPARAPLAGASALTLICGLALPVQSHVDIVWWAATVISAALLVLGVTSRLPQAWRQGPAWTAAATALVALSTEVPSVTSTLSGQIGWIQQPWTSATATVAGSAAQAVATPQQFGGGGNLAALVVAAAMAVAAGLALGRRTIGLLTASGLLALVAVVAVPQLDGPFGAGLLLEGGLTVVAAMAAALLQRRSTLAAQAATVIALGSGFLALAWSLALPSTNAVVAGWLVVTLVAAATVEVPWREVWLGAATLVSGYAAAAIAHQAGATDHALGAYVAAVAVVVSLLLLVRPMRSRAVDVLDGCALAVTAVALLLASDQAGWWSWTLLVSAVWAALTCIRTYRRRFSPIAAAAVLLALAVLPPAQQLAVTATLSSWLVLIAGAVGLSAAAVLVGQPASVDRHRTAAALAVGSVPLGVAALGYAFYEDIGPTVALVALCLVYAAAAALPSRVLTARGVREVWRTAATGLAAAALIGAAASAAQDARLDAGDVTITAVVVAAVLAAAAGRVHVRPRDGRLVEIICAATAVIGAVSAQDDATTFGWVAAIAGVTLLIDASTAERRNWWPFGVLLLGIASWAWLYAAGVVAPEPYTDPIAGVALVAGFLRRRNVTATTSFLAYGPGLSGLLLPSLAWALFTPGVERPLLLAALSTAVVIIGAQQGLRAPLILGGATLLITALRLMAPYETMVPRWVEVGTAGTVLLVLGATYEQRRRDLQLIRARYDALL